MRECIYDVVLRCIVLVNRVNFSNRLHTTRVVCFDWSLFSQMFRICEFSESIHDTDWNSLIIKRAVISAGLPTFLLIWNYTKNREILKLFESPINSWWYPVIYIVSSNPCLIVLIRSAVKCLNQLCTVGPGVIFIVYDESSSDSLTITVDRERFRLETQQVFWYPVSAYCIADSFSFRGKLSWNFVRIIFYLLVLTNKPYWARKSTPIIDLVISVAIQFHVKSLRNSKSNRNGIVLKVGICKLFTPRIVNMYIFDGCFLYTRADKYISRYTSFVFFVLSKLYRKWKNRESFIVAVNDE